MEVEVGALGFGDAREKKGRGARDSAMADESFVSQTDESVVCVCVDVCVHSIEWASLFFLGLALGIFGNRKGT